MKHKKQKIFDLVCKNFGAHFVDKEDFGYIKVGSNLIIKLIGSMDIGPPRNEQGIICIYFLIIYPRKRDNKLMHSDQMTTIDKYNNDNQSEKSMHFS